MKEMMRKRSHPERLHDELWFNEPGEVGQDDQECYLTPPNQSNVVHVFPFF